MQTVAGRPADRTHIERWEYLPGEDPDGRLFVRGRRLYRGIAARRAAFYRRLLRSSEAWRLFDAGVVATRLTDLRTGDDPLVVEHEWIAPVIYPFEWPAGQLRDAALFFCRLVRRLAALGVGVKDAHGYNVLYDFRHRPCYIDFASLVPLTLAPATVHPEFNRYFLNPLYLFRAGAADQARHLIHLGGYGTGSRRGGVDDEEVLPFLGKDQRADYESRRRREAQLRANGQDAELPRFYEEEIQRIELPDVTSDWSTYYDITERYPTNIRFASRTPLPSWQPKQRVIHKLVQDPSVATVLDIGAGGGWFSKLAADAGKNVIAMDNDEAALSRLHREAVDQGLTIAPVYCDVARMAGVYPPTGFKGLDRFRCELVLAGALVHHLVFKAGMTFGDIVKTLAHLTGRTLVLEFLDDRDESVAAFRRQRDVPWYSGLHLRRELERHFARIETADSTGNWHRYLFVCTEKRSPARGDGGAGA